MLINKKLINKRKKTVNNRVDIVIKGLIKNDKRKINLIIPQIPLIIKKNKQLINKKLTK